MLYIIYPKFYVFYRKILLVNDINCYSRFCTILTYSSRRKDRGILVGVAVFLGDEAHISKTGPNAAKIYLGDITMVGIRQLHSCFHLSVIIQWFGISGGSYVKFGFPTAFSTTLMAWSFLEAKDAYQAAWQTKFLKDTLKWATDYFLKAHVSQNEFYGQVCQIK